MVDNARDESADERAERTAAGPLAVPDDTIEPTHSRRGWRLILQLTRERKVGIGLGVFIGLLWTAAKVSTGLLVREAIDQGIDADDTDALRRWAIVLGVVAVCLGDVHRPAPLPRLPRGPLGRGRACATGSSPTSSACTSPSTTRPRPAS